MCGTHRKKGGEREHMSGGSLALTHLSAFIPFISYLFFFLPLSTASSAIQPPVSLTPRSPVLRRYTPTFSFCLSGPVPLSLPSLSTLSISALLLALLPKTLPTSPSSVCHSSSVVGWFAACLSPPCVTSSIKWGQRRLLLGAKVATRSLLFSPLFLLSAHVCSHLTLSVSSWQILSP